METSQGNAEEVHLGHLGAAGKTDESVDQVSLVLSFNMFKLCQVGWQYQCTVSVEIQNIFQLKNLSAAVNMSEVVFYFCKLARTARQPIVWATQWHL